MSEQEEIKIVKLILSNCIKITPENIINTLDGYVVGYVFALAAILDAYYKRYYKIN